MKSSKARELIMIVDFEYECSERDDSLWDRDTERIKAFEHQWYRLQIWLLGCFRSVTRFIWFFFKEIQGA